MQPISLPDLGPALPEIVMAAGALVLVLIGAIKGDRATGLVQMMAAGLVAIVLFMVLSQGGGRVETFSGGFVSDGFSRFMKALALIGSLVALGLSVDWMRKARIERFEYAILVVLATLGMMMMISANDLISLYVGLELQSLAIYVICAIDRDNPRSSEAGLKYFVLGALSSGMYLYGASLVYGFSGALSYGDIAGIVKGTPSLGVVIGLVFVLAGLAFKMSAVPFHMWTPDVYEGAPTPVTAFLAAAPKMAAVAMTVRIVVGAFPHIAPQWQQVLAFVAIASMVLGAFAAIGQTNIKRLMAYSSIGHMGYALVGLVANSAEGVAGVAIYMAIYLVTTLGAFACIMTMRRDGQPVETIADLAGLSRTRPWLAFSLAMLLFSLAGIPPLAGFFAKFYVFAAAVKAGFLILAVVGVVASVVGAYYYLRIVKIMYFDDAAPAFDEAPALVNGVVVVSAATMTLFWLLPAPIVGAATAAARSLF